MSRLSGRILPTALEENAMTQMTLVETLNRAAASLLVEARDDSSRSSQMRCLAVRLQILAMDIEDSRSPAGEIVTLVPARVG